MCKNKTCVCSNSSVVGHLKKVHKNKFINVNNLEVKILDLNFNNLFDLETSNVNFI